MEYFDSHKGFDFRIVVSFPNKYIGKQVTVYHRGCEVASRSAAHGTSIRNNLDMRLTNATRDILKDYWHKNNNVLTF